MEAHPVPQNVTSFEFHLIGDMTLKQFGYLAAGMGSAYLIFIFFYESLPFIAIPLIIFSALMGVAFAFLPLADRPLDHWMVSFFRAIYSPTKRSWAAQNGKSKLNLADPVFKGRLDSYLLNLAPQVSSPPPLAPPSPLNQPQVNPPDQLKLHNLSRLPNTPPAQPIVSQPQVAPTLTPGMTPQQLEQLIAMAKQAGTLQSKVAELENQLIYMKQMMATHPAPAPVIPKAPPVAPLPVAPPVAVPPPVVTTPTKVVVAKDIPKGQISMQLTSSPNVINGVVSEGQGNYLEGVIVIIHNHEGLPVRALKTNKLGQFAGATPLPNGVYTLNLEKDGYNFDTLQVTLDNQVMSAIAVIAKRGGN